MTLAALATNRHRWMALALVFCLVAKAGAEDNAAAVTAGIDAYNKGDIATAFRFLKAASDGGDSDAEVNLGYMYARGHGVVQNQEEAMRLYLLSARQGNAEGMNAVGYKYRFGTGIKPDIGQAVHWFCRAAVSGDGRGLNNLAILHLEGKGVPRDIEEARSLWQQAAERGNPNATFNLGQSLLSGPDAPLEPRPGEGLDRQSRPARTSRCPAFGPATGLCGSNAAAGQHRACNARSR
jgi:TPR repeat protein